MFKVNFKNTAENLGISIVAFIAGAFTCYMVMIKTVDQTSKRILEANNKVIMAAIKKETTSITNEFKTEIKKLKNRKGNSQLAIKPVLDNIIEIKKEDTLDVFKAEQSKGFFKRLFRKLKTKKQ